MTGKALPENQLNCGACGYSTCREKAIAVIEGLAEPEMCLPFARRLAEQRVDRIIETSPNGILILDKHLSILSMNPAFRTMFQCSNAICGKPVS
jgi:Na+-translocating ferredoxin:NAD+ oxidoreductase RNF subunit RnfB